MLNMNVYAKMIKHSPTLQANFKAYNEAIDAEIAAGLSEDEAIAKVMSYWTMPDETTVREELKGFFA